MNAWMRSTLAAALIAAGSQSALAQVSGGTGTSASASAGPLTGGTAAGTGAFVIGEPIVVGALTAGFIAAVAIAVANHGSSSTTTTSGHR